MDITRDKNFMIMNDKKGKMNYWGFIVLKIEGKEFFGYIKNGIQTF